MFLNCIYLIALLIVLFPSQLVITVAFLLFSLLLSTAYCLMLYQGRHSFSPSSGIGDGAGLSQSL